MFDFGKAVGGLKGGAGISDEKTDALGSQDDEIPRDEGSVMTKRFLPPDPEE